MLNGSRADRALELPNFFIIGAPKAGTTSLARFLGAHPEIYMSRPKEPAFFTQQDEYNKGMRYYSRYFRGSLPFRAVGEATPWYMYRQSARDRIRKDLPVSSHRFIAILREPIARALSMYWERARTGLERREIERALRDQLLGGRPADQDWALEYDRNYLAASRYEVFLPSFTEAFGAQSLLLLTIEELRNPDRRPAAIRKMASFLGVAESRFPQELPLANQAHQARWNSVARFANPTKYDGETMAHRFAKMMLPAHTIRRLAETVGHVNRRPAPYPASNSSLAPTTFERLVEYFAPTVEWAEGTFPDIQAYWSYSDLS